jgi:DNA-binding Xre family transcriptional regulator
MGAGGYMLRGDNYDKDKPALTEKLSTMQTSVTQLQEQNRETQGKLNRICIALGVDPDGVLEVRSRKVTNSHD